LSFVSLEIKNVQYLQGSMYIFGIYAGGDNTLDSNTLITFITLGAAGDLTMVGTSPLGPVLGLTSGGFAPKAKDRYLWRDG
jgi:hypothetical protein